MVKELKRELSRLTGLDFFNPKFREVFKKYFPDEEEKSDGEEPVKEETAEAAADNSREDVKAENYDGMMDKLKEKEEDIDKAEDEREIDKIEREKADNPEKRDEKAEEVKEESEEIAKDVDDLKGDKAYVELLEARIENELLRGGVREDKLPHAMRLAKSEIGSMEGGGRRRRSYRRGAPSQSNGHRSQILTSRRKQNGSLYGRVTFFVQIQQPGNG